MKDMRFNVEVSKHKTYHALSSALEATQPVRNFTDSFNDHRWSDVSRTYLFFFLKRIILFQGDNFKIIRSPTYTSGQWHVCLLSSSADPGPLPG